MSNLNSEDIAMILEESNVQYHVDVKMLMDELKEWENLIEELSVKEVLLYKKKEQYQMASDKIIEDTDFKSLYGANNQKVRDNHVKKVLSTDYKTIKDLEFSIDWINRRISFLRELIRVKRTIMESKQ